MAVTPPTVDRLDVRIDPAAGRAGAHAGPERALTPVDPGGRELREGSGGDRLSAADSILWTIDDDPLLRSTITAVVVFDRALKYDQVVDRFASLCRQAYRFRATVAPARAPWGRPSWRVVEHLDVTTHLRHVRVALPGTMRDVLDLAQGLYATPLDPTRPLWEAVVVDGLADGRAALILKVHHAVIDGVGGLLVAARMMDRDRHGTPLLEPTRSERADGGAERSPGLGDRALSAASGVIGSTRQFATAMWTATRHPDRSVRRWSGGLADAGHLVAPSPNPLSPLLRERSLARSFQTVDLDPDLMGDAAERAGVTLNDLFVCGLLRGMSGYHHAQGKPARALRVVMPISTRRPTDALESNRFVPVRVVLPADLSDAGAYLRVVPGILGKWKASPALGMSGVLTDILDRLPSPLTVGAFGMMLKGVDLVATNVPGPPVHAFFAGARVEALHAFAPTAGAAVNAALVTVAGRSSVGCNIDAGAVPDPAELVGHLAQGLDEIFRVANGGTVAGKKG
jgi:diacylglycerol O-acyltransferase / wax synthase